MGVHDASVPEAMRIRVTDKPERVLRRPISVLGRRASFATNTGSPPSKDGAQGRGNRVSWLEATALAFPGDWAPVAIERVVPDPPRDPVLLQWRGRVGF